MRRFLALILTIIILFSCVTIPVFALRAGGGSSGGGGGGGSGGGSSGTHHHSSATNGGAGDSLQQLVPFLGFLLIGSAGVVAFRLRLSKYARSTKKLMKLLQKKDTAWKYKHIQKQVHRAYFAIQNAWTNSDMEPARQYMSDTLYQSFQTKLAWMKYKDQRNVLKHIRLLDAIPVSVHDDSNNALDFVWFYIKGRMVDYTIDTQTNERVEGSSVPTSFCEYWQFTRTPENRWVLNEILQEDESDQIMFSDAL